MSDNSRYSIVSSILAVYDIKSPLDEFGKPKELKADYTSGFLSYVFPLSRKIGCQIVILSITHRYPVPFSCTIEPRSKDADSLIRGAQ